MYTASVVFYILLCSCTGTVLCTLKCSTRVDDVVPEYYTLQYSTRIITVRFVCTNNCTYTLHYRDDEVLSYQSHEA